jgi:hypothetical protein
MSPGAGSAPRTGGQVRRGRDRDAAFHPPQAPHRAGHRHHKNDKCIQGGHRASLPPRHRPSRPPRDGGGCDGGPVIGGPPPQPSGPSEDRGAGWFSRVPSCFASEPGGVPVAPWTGAVHRKGPGCAAENRKDGLRQAGGPGEWHEVHVQVRVTTAARQRYRPQEGGSGARSARPPRAGGWTGFPPPHPAPAAASSPIAGWLWRRAGYRRTRQCPHPAADDRSHLRHLSMASACRPRDRASADDDHAADPTGRRLDGKQPTDALVECAMPEL